MDSESGLIGLRSHTGVDTREGVLWVPPYPFNPFPEFVDSSPHGAKPG
jgi:hypothetical protein